MIRLIDPPNITVTLGDGLELDCLGLGRNALQEWLDRSREGTVVAALCEVVKGWHGIEDSQGQPLPLTAAALARYLDDDEARIDTILSGYIDALTKAREKN